MNSFIVINDPARLPWQTNLPDLLLLTMIIAITAYSIVRFRQGTRIYLALLISAFIYGLVLELVGMATLNMYQQGEFLVMVNWTVIPLWQGTTMMPFYVLIFYPVFLFTGYKVAEALGIRKNWQAAIAGGLVMIALDAPYVIEGNLRHIVWWTWDTDFVMFQFWAGWPLVDLCWQATWGAFFFYLVRRALPMIDSSPQSPDELWSTARILGRFPLVTAATVLLAGSFLLAPLTIATFLGCPQ